MFIILQFLAREDEKTWELANALPGNEPGVEPRSGFNEG